MRASRRDLWEPGGEVPPGYPTILRVNRPGPRLRAAALYGLRRRLLGNAMIESTLGRGQAGLLNRRRWRTRLELADALFEYLEIYCNQAPAALRPRHAHTNRI